MIFENGIAIFNVQPCFNDEEKSILIDSNLDLSVFGIHGFGRCLTNHFERSIYAKVDGVDTHSYIGEIESSSILMIADHQSLIKSCESRGRMNSMYRSLIIPSFHGEIDFVTDDGILYIVGFYDSCVVYDLAFMNKHGILI